VVVNPDPRFAVRELALVRTRHGLMLAALDARDSALSFYLRGPDGTFTRSAGPTIPGVLPVHLAAGDLNGDGRDDQVVATTGTNQIFVYLQNALGGFGPAPDYQSGVGVDPSAISLADVDGDGRPDIVVTNQFSGDVSVLLNDARKPFCSELRFRAGIGLYWMDQRDGNPIIRSFQGSAGVVTGQFEGDNHTDLVVTNSGANSFSLLEGTGLGGFLNPQTALTFSTGVRPTGVVAGDFNHDGHLDLAILNEGSQDISIFLGNGHGGFTERTVTSPDVGRIANPSHGQASRLSAGNAPTGLTLADVNGDGIPDLLVGNAFGDVLTLLGKGDGTFQPYQRAERNVALAVADLNGDGKLDFIFADQARDHVSVQYADPGRSFTQDRSNGLLAPGAVAVADLNGDGIPDLVVANSGANNVLVYLGLGNVGRIGNPSYGQFGPARSFFAGTNPAGVTIHDLNGDGIPDLAVANEGSNDVSILLGQGRGSNWTLDPGPRLRAGAGPVSTTVQDVTGHGISDILVVNSQSDNVFLLPGVGNGFFNDQNPQVFNTGSDPRQALVGDFNGDGKLDLVTVNAGSNDLTLFSAFGAGRSIASGGENPLAAVSADFNHDGSNDLLVVNNGDGRETLLLGGVDGLTRSQTFSRADLPHPTAIVLAHLEDGLAVYVTGEGQESALLLTSFGMAIPLLHAEGERPPLADVFVVNGPGFTSGVDILSQRDDSPSRQPAVPGAKARQALPQDPPTPALEPPAFAGEAGAEAGVTPGAPIEESAGNSFRMELEGIFRPDRLDGLPGRAGSRADPVEEPPVEEPPAILDQVFRHGLEAPEKFAIQNWNSETSAKAEMPISQSSRWQLRDLVLRAAPLDDALEMNATSKETSAQALAVAFAAFAFGIVPTQPRKKPSWVRREWLTPGP
jgi:hypothetical protein